MQENINNDVKLPREIGLLISSFLSTKDKANLYAAWKFFYSLRDDLSPIYPIWNSFLTRVLKQNQLIDLTKIDITIEKEFCQLIKSYLTAIIRNGKFIINDYLREHNELIEILWKITKEPTGVDIPMINKLHNAPETAWLECQEQHIRKDREPTQMELMALFVHNFRKLHIEGSPALSEAEKLMHHILFGSDLCINKPEHMLYNRAAHFNFASLENIISLLKFLPKSRRDQLLPAMQQLAVWIKDETIIKKISLYLLERLFSILFKDHVESQHRLTIKNLMSSLLSEFTHPYLPLINNNDIINFHIRYTFKNPTERMPIENKLKQMGFSIKTGTAKGEFVIDIIDMDPVTLLVTCAIEKSKSVCTMQCK